MEPCTCYLPGKDFTYLISNNCLMTVIADRYGKGKMETKLKELFGENMLETGREGGEITYSKYLNAVEKIQIQSFYSTQKGKIALARDTFKMKGTLNGSRSIS